ncbi:MAG: ABC transporter ATP-binding protein [Gemmatimonadota bacterium]|nr:ABC transporter ATP-binding protein [Gemmatimonadota bacterium]
MVSVTLEQVTKDFGEVQAVRTVSLDIQKGELFFMLGPSGCGKTTLLRMIAGFYLPTAGRILFDERDISRTPPHKRNAGMVFQNYALWPHMTVRENVAYGLSLRKIPTGERRQRVNEALYMVRMKRYADRAPNQLSGGQQQRIALARALVINPDVVLLDEPLSNLDAKLRVEMRDEIRRIHDEIGATMIYVTHDQKEALSMADRIAIVGAGEVRQVGDPRTVYNQPANRFVAHFIGETNFIDGTITCTGEKTSVDTAVGCLLSTAPSDKPRNEGDPVACSIRPEAIRIADGNHSGDTYNYLSAHVTQIMYLGEHEQYTLVLGDETTIKAVAQNPDHRKAQVGDEVQLSFPTSRVVLLDRE